jgi:putative tricarboxylic transport membrane protein
MKSSKGGSLLKAFLNRERIIALACLVFAGWMYYEAGTFPKSALDTVGPSLYPRFLAVAIGVSSIALLLMSKSGKSEPIEGKRKFKGIGVVLGTILLYILIFGKLGFILSTIISMILALYFDRRE